MFQSSSVYLLACLRSVWRVYLPTLMMSYRMSPCTFPKSKGAGAGAGAGPGVAIVPLLIGGC